MRDHVRVHVDGMMTRLRGWDLAGSTATSRRVGGVRGVHWVWCGRGGGPGGWGDTGGGLGEDCLQGGLHRGGALLAVAAATPQLLIVRCSEAAVTAARRGVRVFEWGGGRCRRGGAVLVARGLCALRG